MPKATSTTIPQAQALVATLDQPKLETAGTGSPGCFTGLLIMVDFNDDGVPGQLRLDMIGHKHP